VNSRRKKLSFNKKAIKNRAVNMGNTTTLPGKTMERRREGKRRCMNRTRPRQRKFNACKISMKPTKP
jgi:hypothetical protein